MFYLSLQITETVTRECHHTVWHLQLDLFDKENAARQWRAHFSAGAKHFGCMYSTELCGYMYVLPGVNKLSHNAWSSFIFILFILQTLSHLLLVDVHLQSITFMESI